MTLDSTAIYRFLRRCLKRSVPVVTYTQVMNATGIPHRGARINNALGILVRRCHHRGWPAIAALVVRSDWGFPGALYYPVAHGLNCFTNFPRATFEWAKEVSAVAAHAARYTTPL